MNNNKAKNKQGKGKRSPNATIDYLLKKKNLIYKWIASGLTMSDIANKLSVSRSWLFEAFKANQELAAIRDEAYDDRRERLKNTLYQMALGTYKTKVRHSKTTKTTVNSLDNTGKVTSTKQQSITENTEDTIEHVNDPNFRAVAIIMKQEGIMAPSDAPNMIEDTIDENKDLTFIDVANIEDDPDE